MTGIILSQTYQIVTPESAEYGDIDESGFDWEDVEYTFRELVELIEREEFFHPSCSAGIPGWLTCEPYIADYTTGETMEKSLHPANDARTQRYWAKAVKYCRDNGIIN